MNVDDDKKRAAGAHPLGAGGPRSAPTRRAILDAARELFAARGYEKTTIRAIAAKAQIDPSMVMRYYGDKAQLFTAAATIDLRATELGNVPHERWGEVLVRDFLDRWHDEPSRASLSLLLRTAVTNDAVAEQVKAQFQQLVVEPVTASGDPLADRRGALITTQLLGLVLCRYVLQFPTVSALPLESVVAAVAPTIQHYLTMDVEDPR